MLIESDAVEREQYNTVIDTVGAILVHLHDARAGRRGPHSEPERRLAAAVCIEAIDDLGRHSPHRIMDAWNWINSTYPSTHPYTFNGICRLMHIDEDAARETLANRYALQIAWAEAMVLAEPVRKPHKKHKRRKRSLRRTPTRATAATCCPPRVAPRQAGSAPLPDLRA